MRRIDEIAVHCSATQPNWMHNRPLSDKVREIRLWHKARGWSDIGYHFVIDRDGSVMAARPVERVGAHIKGHNKGKIAVCLLGGHGSSADDQFDENFTLAQDKSLRSFIDHLKKEYPTIVRVSGHNQYAAKACPGFNVPTWLKASATKPSGLWALIQSIFNAIFKRRD